jgi:CheY-like chemotaxis protein
MRENGKLVMGPWGSNRSATEKDERIRKLEARVAELEDERTTSGSSSRTTSRATSGSSSRASSGSSYRASAGDLPRRSVETGELLAMMSHELRNPLASIRNSLYILQHTPVRGDAARRAMDVLDRQVNQLTRLVEDLLETVADNDRPRPNPPVKRWGSEPPTGALHPNPQAPLDGAEGVDGRDSSPVLTPGRTRVLIIEDNVDAAETLREALELCDHEVQVAYNGTDGLALAEEMQPDILLCDLGLPGIDGFGVARAFRHNDALRGTFLVALSGYAQPEDRQRARDAGFDRHIAKPPRLSALVALIASVRAGQVETAAR